MSTRKHMLFQKAWDSVFPNIDGGEYFEEAFIHTDVGPYFSCM